MLHAPEPCTRLHAGLLQRGRPRRAKCRRTEGVILVHPQGPSRRNARGPGGAWGWGRGTEPECPSLCCLPPTPTRQGCTEPARALPYMATEESGLSRLFVFDFWGLSRGDSTRPGLKSGVRPRLGFLLPVVLSAFLRQQRRAHPGIRWATPSPGRTEGVRAGRRQQRALLPARRWGGGQAEREGAPCFRGGRCGPRREEPQEVEEGSRLALRLLEQDSSFRFRVPGVFSPVTGKQHTFWGRGSTGDSPQGPFCPPPPPCPVGIWQRPEAFWSLLPQAGTGIQE